LNFGTAFCQAVAFHPKVAKWSKTFHVTWPFTHGKSVVGVGHYGAHRSG
jgi:hypothetical protein